MCSGQITGISGDELTANRVRQRVGFLAIAMAAASALAGCSQDSTFFSATQTGPTAKPPAKTPAKTPANTPANTPAKTPARTPARKPSAVPATGFAIVSWIAPTENTDGSPLTNLAGYRVRYGLSVGRLAVSADVPNPGTTSIRIEGLGAGTWYFTVSAYTNVGVEGAQSAAVSKTIR
jgi:hypothetical protein